MLARVRLVQMFVENESLLIGGHSTNFYPTGAHIDISHTTPKFYFTCIHNETCPAIQIFYEHVSITTPGATV